MPESWMKRLQRIVPPPPGGFASWEELMLLALDEAALAQDAKEVPVGAVVVTEKGEIIGRGYNRTIMDHDPTAHAEVVAIREACAHAGNYRLDGCFLVVTLEPCLMCTGAIVHARIKGVVYGAEDPKTGAVISRLDGFEQPFLNHSTWHMGGVCASLCQAMLQDFFSPRR